MNHLPDIFVISIGVAPTARSVVPSEIFIRLICSPITNGTRSTSSPSPTEVRLLSLAKVDFLCLMGLHSSQSLMP